MLTSQTSVIESTTPQLTLVLGGARSGKSRYAENLITACRPPWIFMATAEPGDAEMTERIALHRRWRGPGWQTIEAPHDLTAALAAVAAHTPVLVDCLTLWLSNLMAAGRDPSREMEDLVRALGQAGGPVVFVSNEVGLGIVPDNALARAFRDHAGRLNQRIAEVANSVFFVAAGLPLRLK